MKPALAAETVARRTCAGLLQWLDWHTRATGVGDGLRTKGVSMESSSLVSSRTRRRGCRGALLSMQEVSESLVSSSTIRCLRWGRRRVRGRFVGRKEGEPSIAPESPGSAPPWGLPRTRRAPVMSDTEVSLALPSLLTQSLNMEDTTHGRTAAGSRMAIGGPSTTNCTDVRQMQGRRPGRPRTLRKKAMCLQLAKPLAETGILHGR